MQFILNELEYKEITKHNPLADAAIEGLKEINEAYKEKIEKQERHITIYKITEKELRLMIDNLNDELKWVYDNSNEQHILDRVAKIVPPEDR